MKKCQICKLPMEESVRKSNNLNCSRECASFYNRWAHIVQRCTNKSNKAYLRYGGRGINVSTRWLEFENFRNDMFGSFLAHVKEYGLWETTIERVNNDMGYEMANCKWVTRMMQARNRRRPQKKCSSIYKGVSWNKRARRWITRVGINRKRYFVGAFKNEEEAYEAYKNAKEKLQSIR